MNYLGDFPDDHANVDIFFHTFDSNDPSASVAIAALVLADVAVYKDGGTTQRSSTTGFTLLDTDGIDFDGVVGIGGVTLDLSDNTDAGFFAPGSEYAVVIGPVTIDAAVINFVAATFSIERAGGPLALIKAGASVDVTAVNGVTLGTGAVPELGIVDSGTAQSATATTLVLRVAAGFANNELTGSVITITGGTTGVGQSAVITSNGFSSDTVNVDTWTTTPTGTITYVIFASPQASAILPSPANVVEWLGTAAATPTTAGVPEVDVTFVGGLSEDIATETALATAQMDLDIITGADGVNLLSATQTSVDAIETDTAAMQPLVAKIPVSDGTVTWNATALASINSEVVDVIRTDTVAELAGVPAATSSLEDKVNWLFMLARNKGTQTATTKTLLADNGSTPVSTSTVSDDGTTFTRGEFS